MLQSQNTSLPVGTIPGAIDVSPMGAATYTIPIEVVPGTQGMQPNLSIVYNSMGGMGLLGSKWDLEGLSSISRCAKTNYYDGTIESLKFNAYAFSLDGKRLVKADNQYAAEAEDFMRITLNNNYFIATTDDGTIIEYGKTSNSRQTMDNTNNILSWRINKITDANGNYMTFTYFIAGNNELLINNINYTYNTGIPLQYYASVHFDYTNLPNNLGRNTCFVGGYGVDQTQLLEAITVKYNNTQVRKYVFSYLPADSARIAHLKEVKLYGENNNTVLSKTTIKWEDHKSALSSTQAPIQSNQLQGYFLPGDFNGDGYTDYVAYGVHNQQTVAKRYLKNATSDGYYFADSLKNLEAPGDNCFYFKVENSRDGMGVAWRKDDTKDFYFQFHYGFGIGGVKEIKNFHQFFIGDFDGDGETDILFMTKDDNNECKFEAFISSYGFVDFKPMSVTGSCKLRVVDSDGKGKSDIEVHYHDGNIYTYWFDNSTGQFKKYSDNSQPTAYYNNTSRYSGDFNGDGITDLLTFEDNVWKLSFGKGNRQYSAATNLNGPLNINVEVLHDGTVVPKYKIMIADLDGDGKDDIIQIGIGILFSKGIDNEQYKFTGDNISWVGTLQPDQFSIADFNNDGTLDLMCQVNREHVPQMSYLPNGKLYDCVKEITDGMGKKIELSFKCEKIPSRDFNAAQGTIKKYSLYVLSGLKVSDGINNPVNSFKYVYDDPAFSWRKRSFLGYTKFTSTNILEDKTEKIQFITDNNLLYNSKHILIPLDQRTQFADTIYSDTDYKIDLFPLAEWPRYIACNKSSLSYRLSDVTVKTIDSLDFYGRLTERTIITWDQKTRDFYYPESYLEEHQYYTQTAYLLSNGVQKTVPTKIFTMQKYKAAPVALEDTLFYGYNNKGNLTWEKKSNIDGSISTSYGNYYPAGVYGTKTVSAPDCTPRTETYSYDATQRFATAITNPLNHTTTFTYDPKTGNKTSETDPNGLTTSYYYDVFGDLSKIVYPDNTETNISKEWHSSSGLPNARYSITTKTTGKPEVTVYYDILGREVRRKEDRSYYDTRYNAKGQVEKTSYPYYNKDKPDSEKVWNEFTYDYLGRKSTEKAPYIHLSYKYKYFWMYYNCLGTYLEVTVTDSLRNISSCKKYDIQGRITMAKDTGGTIDYDYEITNNKRHKTTIKVNGATTTILSDLWGNRLSIVEPNAGTITYQYNKFNELVYMRDALFNITSYEYDALGRILKKQYKNADNKMQTIDYYYDKSVNGKGKLSSIVADGKSSENFSYDDLSRLKRHAKFIANMPYAYQYTYNKSGQLHTLTYPDEFSITYSYDPTNGKLSTISCTKDNSCIYRTMGRNEFGATTLCDFGNDLASAYTYNPYGLLTQIKTGNKYTVISEEGEILPERGDLGGAELPIEVGTSILHYQYAYNNLGLMTSRTESVVNQKENYTYDLLDRLTQNKYRSNIGINNTQTFDYHKNGNMIFNSNVGNYNYHNVKKNAVTQITPITTALPQEQCIVAYNFFNQPILIEEGAHKLELLYDADQQRNKMLSFKNDLFEYIRCYVSKNYEADLDSIPQPPPPDTIIQRGIELPPHPPTYYTLLKFLRHYHYIYADNRLVALHITTVATDSTPATDSMYYIHTDHLGSICALTNAEQQVRQRNWFGPFGDYGGVYYEPFAVVRQGEGEDTTATRGASGLKFPLTTRGFTGHEHYPQFKIINMNGRLYDPIICRFFSPDNFVQAPEETQSFNRYSYCLNNPLKYTDPTGWIVEYDSFGDRVRTFFQRIFDKEFRQDFRDMKKDEKTYVISYNTKGDNNFTKAGNKLFVNYSLTEDAKNAGDTKSSLLRHEARHGGQFARGEFGYRLEETGWGTVDGSGNYYPHSEWRPFNYDVYDELDAHQVGYGNFSWQSGTKRDEFKSMSTTKQLDDVKDRYKNHLYIEKNLQLNNPVVVPASDRYFMNPYRPKK